MNPVAMTLGLLITLCLTPIAGLLRTFSDDPFIGRLRLATRSPRYRLVSPPSPFNSGKTSAKFEYAVRYDPTVDPSKLFVSLKASGLSVAKRARVFELPDWGEWTSAKFSYLRNLQVDGRPRTIGRNGTLVIPHRLAADGLLLSYELVVSPVASAAHLQRPLLPYRTDSHLFAFVQNTLLRERNSPTPSSETVVRVVTNARDSVFTGWAGLSQGEQISTIFDPAAVENGIFAVGRMTDYAKVTHDGMVVEVGQFAAPPSQARAVADIAAALLPSYSRATDCAPQEVVRIILNRSLEDGVFRGTYTDAGIVLELPGDDALPDAAKELIAHELFHHWLGGLLANDGSLTWFSEGFTDYIGLLNSVAMGMTSPSRFAERILQIERSVQSAGSDSQPRFAAANVNWRAGKNETIAYRRGALLAFLVDVRLRQRSKGTVFEIIRTLLRAGPATYRLSHLHDAMTTLGVADVYDHFIVGNDQLPEARFLLTTIGYDEVREPAALTYLGIEAQSLAPPNSDDVVPALVIEVDPSGPSAKAGIKAGDTIISYGSRRSNPPQLGAGAPARYRFGLNLIPSGAKSVFFEMRRDGMPIRLEVTPVIVPGGHRTVLRWNAVRATKFFDLNTTER